MSRDKQIEEIKSVLIHTCKRIRTFDEDWMQGRYAEALYTAGYRKASEVAREIFEEIEDVLNNIGYFDEIDFKALKKKYTEEGK